MGVFQPVAWVLCGWVAVSLYGLTLVRVCGTTREGECITNLKGFFTAERAFKSERGTYSASFHEIGFKPEPANRYLYTIDPLARGRDQTVFPDPERGWKFEPAMIPARVEGDVLVGLEPYSDGSVTAVCVGDVDGDPEVDVWSVSTAPRVARSGEVIVPGVPWHDRVDRESAKPERGTDAW